MLSRARFSGRQSLGIIATLLALGAALLVELE